MVPSIAKAMSGTDNTGITSGLWAWPQSGYQTDKQQGSWSKM